LHHAPIADLSITRAAARLLGCFPPENEGPMLGLGIVNLSSDATGIVNLQWQTPDGRLEP
jgi:hypothetical protein